MSSLIIVESENDKYFIEAFLDKLNLDNVEVGKPICEVNDFDCLGGEKNLEPRLESLKLDRYDKIGIILDADDKGTEKRIEFINQALKSSCDDIELTQINKFEKSKTLELEIACYIMNIDDKGELETVMRVVKSKDSLYADCLDAWRECLKKQEIEVKQKEFDKIWVSHYLKYDTCISSKHKRKKTKYCANELINNTENDEDIQNNLKSTKETLQKDIWNFEHTVLEQLKEFLFLFSKS